MKKMIVLLSFVLAAACDPASKVIPSELDASYAPVSVQGKVDAVQPATGLVLWSENARERNAAYGKSISLEYAYCLPCQVVTGKDNGVVRYDWSSFNKWLADVASRRHQAVVRFRYEYPGERNVDGKPGTTAVPVISRRCPITRRRSTKTKTDPPGMPTGPTVSCNGLPSSSIAISTRSIRMTRASLSSRSASDIGASIISSERRSSPG